MVTTPSLARAPRALLASLLARRLRHVEVPLILELPGGQRLTLGGGATVTVRVQGPQGALALLRPTLSGLASAYVRGDLDVEGPIEDAIGVAESLCASLCATGAPRKRRRRRAHDRRRDEDAVSFHYDVGNDFYSLWLDRSMVYSCAYFGDGEADLDEAQTQKLDYVCRKLMLGPGQRFLDVGCGWGALVLHAAAHYGVEATGITLSVEQLREAQRRIDRAGLQHRCRVQRLDYRDLPSEPSFDRVASVGMVEHVGLENLGVYAGALYRCLRPGGLLLNHGIATSSAEYEDASFDGGAFIERTIFPDTDLPHLATTVEALSRAGMEVIDVESLRPHYARTLDCWRARLEARADRALAMVGPRRLRAWRIYLAGAAHAFRRGWVNVYQTLAVRDGDRQGLPWTRAHLYPASGAASTLALRR